MRSLDIYICTGIANVTVPNLKTTARSVPVPPLKKPPAKRPPVQLPKILRLPAGAVTLTPIRSGAP